MELEEAAREGSWAPGGEVASSARWGESRRALSGAGLCGRELGASWVGPSYPTVPLRTLASSSLPSAPPRLCSRSSSLASSTSGGESLSEEELARILEQVEDKKKLIATMRTKPWPMARKLAGLR